MLNGADVQKPVAHRSLCGLSLGVSAHPGDATTGSSGRISKASSGHLLRREIQN